MPSAGFERPIPGIKRPQTAQPPLFCIPAYQTISTHSSRTTFCAQHRIVLRAEPFEMRKRLLTHLLAMRKQNAEAIPPVLQENYERKLKLYKKIVRMFIPSSFCIKNFLLPAGRGNFAEVAERPCLYKHKDWYSLGWNTTVVYIQNVLRFHGVTLKRNFINGLSHTHFHETYKCSTPLHADLLYRISPKSDSKCRKYEYNFIYANLHSMVWFFSEEHPTAQLYYVEGSDIYAPQ